MTNRTTIVDNMYFTDGGTLQVPGYPPEAWGFRARAGFYSAKVQEGTDGKDRENPYSLTYSERYEPEGTWGTAVVARNSIVAYPPYANAYTVDMLGPETALTESDRLAVLSSVLSKVRGADWNALVTIGEGRETVKLLADTVMAIARLARKSRRQAIHRLRSSKVVKVEKGKPVKELLKEASRVFPGVLRQKWLEARYGWIPLLSDIKSILDYFSERKAAGTTTRFRSRGKRVEPRFLNGWPSVTLSRIQILVLVREAPSEISRLGLNDPLSLVWEKLPLSFVADWVLPIGDYLAAVHMKRSFTATYITSEKNLSYLECQNHSYGGYSFSGNAPLRLLRLRFRRTIGAGDDLSIPLGFRDPRESSSAYKHLADASALLGQQLSSRLTSAERRKFLSGR